MRKKIIAALALVTLTVSLTGCASLNRAMVDLQSDMNGGLDRTVNVYTANGELLATYKGKIDLEANESGAVKFDFKGKRYIYYNCFIETIGDIEQK